MEVLRIGIVRWKSAFKNLKDKAKLPSLDLTKFYSNQ